MKNIEVETRAFISEERYKQLIDFFKANAEFLNEDYQETYYFDCEQDLRIQKNNRFAKLWLKKGNLHDDHREEYEVKVKTDQFEMLEKILTAIGYNVEIKWFRNRHRFNWNDIKVCIDFTKGYGYIIELEQMSTEKDKETILQLLKQKMSELNIIETPKSDFKTKYEFYRKNWQTLTL